MRIPLARDAGFIASICRLTDVYFADVSALFARVNAIMTDNIPYLT